MTVSVALVSSGSAETSNPEITTPVVSPTPGTRLLLFLVTDHDILQPGEVTSSSVVGLGGTWNRKATHAWGSTRLSSIFFCNDWASSGTLTLSQEGVGVTSTVEAHGWILLEISGVLTDEFLGAPAIVADGANDERTSVSFYATLDGVEDALVSFLGLEEDSIDPSVGASWTELADLPVPWIRRVSAAWASPPLVSGQTTPWTFPSASAYAYSVAILKENQEESWDETFLDNTITQGSSLASSPLWVESRQSGSGEARSDKHPDHSDGHQVMDLHTTGVVWMFYTPAIESVDQRVETRAWPDRDYANAIGVISRWQNPSEGFSSGSGYLLEAQSGGQFDYALVRINNGFQQTLGFVENNESWWGASLKAITIRLEVTGTDPVVCRGYAQLNGSTGPLSTIFEYTDDSADRVTVGSYTGRYFNRSGSGTHGQPFSQNFYVKSLVTATPPTWDGSYLRIGNTRYRVRMHDGNKASIRSHDNLRF